MRNSICQLVKIERWEFSDFMPVKRLDPIVAVTHEDIKPEGFYTSLQKATKSCYTRNWMIDKQKFIEDNRTENNVSSSKNFAKTDLNFPRSWKQFTNLYFQLSSGRVLPARNEETPASETAPLPTWWNIKINRREELGGEALSRVHLHQEPNGADQWQRRAQS